MLLLLLQLLLSLQLLLLFLFISKFWIRLVFDQNMLAGCSLLVMLVAMVAVAICMFAVLLKGVCMTADMLSLIVPKVSNASLY